MAFEMPHSILPLIMEERRMDKKKRNKGIKYKALDERIFKKKRIDNKIRRRVPHLHRA